MKISVVMPHFIQNEETLRLAQQAVSSLGECFLITVDNGSTIGGGYLRSVSDIYIRNNENLGFAKAVNQGLALSKTPLVGIFNNDIRVSPNWQEVTQEVLKDDKTYSCHFRMTDYDIPFSYGKQIVYAGKERWCQGSCFVIDKSKVLFFYDEGYLNSYDDWDLFQMVRKSGLRTAYTDKACFQHNHSFTQKQINKRNGNNIKNSEYFKNKWGGYAEDLFKKDFPTQMIMDYQKGFEL